MAAVEESRISPTFLITPGPADRHHQAVTVFGHIFNIERSQLGSAQRTCETDKKQRPLSYVAEARASGATSEATTFVRAARFLAGAVPFVRRVLIQTAWIAASSVGESKPASSASEPLPW